MSERTMVDWDLAVRIGSRLGGDGPSVSPGQARAVVAELRADADRSTSYVRDYTGLDAPAGTAPVLVVDRAGWVQANADAFATIIDPIAAKLAQKASDKMASDKKAGDKKGGDKRGSAPGAVAQAIGSRVTGTEVGALLGFLSSRVLGQFDPFHDPYGRLLLVAPNVVHVEQQLDVDPTDFRLWVCLHEETHRVQFTAVPWLRGHLQGELARLVDSVEPQSTLEEGLKRIGELVRGDRSSLLDVVSTPEQREILDRVTGVMSLLEGHADVVMDGVGPTVIPTVADIRRKFTHRRQGVGALDRLLRRLLGMDAKMAQYRDGAVFVRAVVERAGMDGFNAVWSEADHLPSKAEIADPEAWVARVLG